MPKREWKREQIWLREMLVAPTKSGKTLGALATAATIFNGELPIVGIDTEHERMKLYAKRVALADYRVIEGNYSPEVYVSELDDVEREHTGGILIIDSVTPEWSNTGGVLEIVDKGGTEKGNWKEGTPRHNKFVERLASLQMHVIVCCRAKMKWDYSTDSAGRRKQVLLGYGPEQRDSLLYEFDIVGNIEQETHLCTFAARDVPELDGQTLNLVPDLNDLKAKNQVSDIITKWLSDGEPLAPVEAADEKQVIELRGMLVREGHSEAIIDERFAIARRQNRGQLHPDYVTKQIAAAKERAAKKEPKPASAPTGGSETKDERAPTQAKTKKSEPVAA